MQKQELTGFGTVIFGSLLLTLIIMFPINWLFGAGTLEFQTVFIPIIICLSLLTAIGNVMTIRQNSKIEQASLKKAEEILKDD